MQIQMPGINGPINLTAEGPYKVAQSDVPGEEFYWVTSEDCVIPNNNVLISMFPTPAGLIFDKESVTNVVEQLNKMMEKSYDKISRNSSTPQESSE